MVVEIDLSLFDPRALPGQGGTLSSTHFPGPRVAEEEGLFSLEDQSEGRPVHRGGEILHRRSLDGFPGIEKSQLGGRVIVLSVQIGEIVEGGEGVVALIEAGRSDERLELAPLARGEVEAEVRLFFAHGEQLDFQWALLGVADEAWHPLVHFVVAEVIAEARRHEARAGNPDGAALGRIVDCRDA